MSRQYHRWYSQRLHRDMECLTYGHSGTPLIVFPTSMGRFFEYEDRGMVGTLWPAIEQGRLQVCCVDGIDRESWYNKHAHPADRVRRHHAYDDYVAAEVVPLLRGRTWSDQLIVTGCSFGGYHAMNFALRHPDQATFCVAMSAAFNVPERFLDGHYDENAYYHTPPDFLQNLSDGWWLDRYRRNHYLMAVGEHDPLIGENWRLAHVMGVKGIPHTLDIWGGWCHDWPYWLQMARKFFL